MAVFGRWLYLTALMVWVGEIVFFSFVVAPKVFRTFPTADAGRAVSAIFPTYYIIGYICGAVLLCGSIGFLLNGGTRGLWSVSAALSAAMLAATLYAGIVVQPRATALRPQIHAEGAAPTVKDEFDRLHRMAVRLNGAVLVGGIILSVMTATKLRP